MLIHADQLDMILMTPLRPIDIPLSSVDFHISSIVEELLQRSQIRQAAQALVEGQRQRDEQGWLQRAMWLFRSGMNNKELLHANKDQWDGRKDEEKSVLQQLWRVSQAPADAWSSDYIRRRFV